MTHSMPLILVIEDEAPIRRFLRASLPVHNFRLIEAATGESGLQMAAARRPDLVIMDLGLPDLDGIDVIRQIRAWSDVPIVVVSARDQEADKVEALDAGADDYLTKPFGIGELLARLRVAMRRRVGLETSPVTCGDWQIDLSARRVVVSGLEVHLTPAEFRLLKVLVHHIGKVVTHRQLLRELGSGPHEDAHHTLRVHMSRLRHKLESDPIRPRHLTTEPGIGYRLREDAPS